MGMYGLLIDMFVTIIKCIYTQVLKVLRLIEAKSLNFRVLVDFAVKLWQYGEIPN